MNVTQQGIVILLKSAVIGKKLELPADFSLKEACKMMSKQHVLPLAYQGAVNCGMPKEEPLMQQLLMRYCQQMVRSEKQMRAVQQICQAFEKNGIDYMLLKGCNMKRLYPKPELRVMGDADILIHPEQKAAIKSVMEQLGFELKNENDHVFCWRSDELSLELHKSLVPPTDSDYYAFYGTGWQFGKKRSGHRYDMSEEDELVFLVTHFAKHYRGAGIGCRHVTDLYVFRRMHPDLDEVYIREELAKLRLLEFYENMLRLLQVWFEDAEADEITELITTVVFSGGSWGTAETQMCAQEAKDARKRGKVRYTNFHAVVRAIFPPLNTIKLRYTILCKAPVLLPVMWVVRWIDILFFSPKNVRRKLKILRSVSDEKILSHQQALNRVGLDYHF